MAVTPNLTRKTLVLARRESTYGTDAAPGYTGANSSAMLLWDEINPIQRDTKVLDQQVVRASFTKYPDLVGRSLYRLKPKTMLMTSPGGAHSHSDAGWTTGTGDNTGNSAAKGKPPFWGPLFRACGVKETVNSSSTVVYTPVSSSFSSATAYVWADGLKHISTGLYGTSQFEGRAGEGIEIMFDMQGQYAEPSSVSIPTSVTYPADGKSLVEKESLTISSGYVAPVSHGPQTPVTGPVVRSFSFDLGVSIIERPDMNSPYGLFGLWPTDRRPTLNLVVEVENNLATTSPYFNPWTILSSGSSALQTITFTHGQTSANMAEFTFNGAQLRELQYADDNGVRTYNLTFNLTSVTDDAEWQLRIL
jgi:hypothetical protein